MGNAVSRLNATGNRRYAAPCCLWRTEAPLRRVIARNLTQRGHRPIAVDSVGEAIAPALATRLPDVVVLDISLPDGTGWDVLRWLRTIHRPVVVIICSAIRPHPRTCSRNTNRMPSSSNHFRSRC